METQAKREKVAVAHPPAEAVAAPKKAATRNIRTSQAKAETKSATQERSALYAKRSNIQETETTSKMQKYMVSQALQQLDRELAALGTDAEMQHLVKFFHPEFLKQWSKIGEKTSKHKMDSKKRKYIVSHVFEELASELAALLTKDGKMTDAQMQHLLQTIHPEIFELEDL